MTPHKATAFSYVDRIDNDQVASTISISDRTVEEALKALEALEGSLEGSNALAITAFF